MPAQKSDVTSLETRKRLLVMESELNRAYLCEEIAHLVDDLRAVGDRLQSVSSMASSLFTSFAPKNNGEEAAPEKPSWLSTIIRGVKVGSSLWLAFRSKS
jgi:hypothetical protein